MSPPRPWHHQALAFFVVGVLSFVADLGTLWALHGNGMPLIPATLGGMVAGFFVNFGLNRRHVFASTGRLHGQLARYFSLGSVNFVVTLVLVPTLAALGVDYRIAKTLVVASLAVVNFLVYRVWVFV